MASNVSLLSIPKDVLLLILRQLNEEELFSMTQVCQVFKKMTEENGLWKKSGLKERIEAYIPIGIEGMSTQLKFWQKLTSFFKGYCNYWLSPLETSYAEVTRSSKDIFNVKKQIDISIKEKFTQDELDRRLKLAVETAARAKEDQGEGKDILFLLQAGAEFIRQEILLSLQHFPRLISALLASRIKWNRKLLDRMFNIAIKGSCSRRLFSLLLKRGVTPSEYKLYVVIHAYSEEREGCAWGGLSLLKDRLSLLLEHGSKPSERELNLAVKNCPEVLPLLLKHGVRPSTETFRIAIKKLSNSPSISPLD